MLLREIIMDHYQNPRNKEEVNDQRYKTIRMDSASCIDDIYIQVLIEDDIVKDCKFHGVGCAISTASTSIMTELVTGKSVKEAENIMQNYQNMILEKPYDPEVLGEAIAFMNTSKQASRINCATIGWRGLEEIFGTESRKRGGPEDERTAFEFR